MPVLAGLIAATATQSVAAEWVRIAPVPGFSVEVPRGSVAKITDHGVEGQAGGKITGPEFEVGFQYPMNWADPPSHPKGVLTQLKINGHKAWMIEAGPDTACKGGGLVASVYDRKTPPGPFGETSVVTFSSCNRAKNEGETVLKIVKSVRFVSDKRG